MDLENLKNEFYCLLEEAKGLLAEENVGKDGQMIILKTAKSNKYHFVNYFLNGPEDEERFLQMLRNRDDTQVQYLVCMWYGYQLDVPSMHFRQGLIGICPRNENAIMVLQGENVLHARTIAQTMPPKRKA